MFKKLTKYLPYVNNIDMQPGNITFFVKKVKKFRSEQHALNSLSERRTITSGRTITKSLSARSSHHL